MAKQTYTMRYVGPPGSYVPGIPRSDPFEVEGAAERDALLASGNVEWVDRPEPGETAPKRSSRRRETPPGGEAAISVTEAGSTPEVAVPEQPAKEGE